MKILETYWFMGGGIVRVQTDYESIKYYIRGLGDDMNDAEMDEQSIANWGSTFPNAVGDALFGMTEMPENLPSILKYQAE